MATTRYTTFDGEIVLENRGGVMRDYVPDALGSTVALLDNTQVQTDTFSYWPYGENSIRTGTTPTPFQFVGTQNYYRDSNNRIYLRTGILNSNEARNMAANPLPNANSASSGYLYAFNNPATYTVQSLDRGIHLPLQLPSDLQLPSSQQCKWNIKPFYGIDWDWLRNCQNNCLAVKMDRTIDADENYKACMATATNQQLKGFCEILHQKDLKELKATYNKCLDRCSSHVPPPPPPPKRPPRTEQHYY